MADEITRIQGLDGEAQASDEDALMLSLRERSATALERALGFIESNGDELALLRAHFFLEAADSDGVIAALESRQLEDGSFEPLGFVLPGGVAGELGGAGCEASLLGGAEALVVLSAARGLARPVAERLVGWLARAQRSDGSWGPLDPVREKQDPEGATERAVADRLFLTGLVSGFLLRTPFVRPEVASWADRFLSDLWAPERVENGRLLAIAGFASFFAGGGGPDLADEAMQWCGRELERGFRTHRFEAGDTLRVLYWCDADAMPGATFDAVELLDRLLSEQGEDGGFAALDPGGAPGRVGPTIDALHAIRALCAAL